MLRPTGHAAAEILTPATDQVAAETPPFPSSPDLTREGTDFGFGVPTQSAPDLILGLDLGGVTIRRLIGAGGMGRVYEGWQAAPGRAVAVKVMRPGLASDEFFRRFDHEARLLARLQHPGIAQVFLVGVYRLPAGEVPFFVLEYLAEAVPITDHARTRALDLHRRLDLFRQACAAVAHGHERGVIHRDLKPGNILVDAQGRAKVIDFGVARSTDADAALTTLETDAGRILGTLQYMSPEQFAAGADEAGVRSDVYALGVVLFELLADRLPYDVRRRPLAEAARIVQETPAPAVRSIDRSLPRDLDVIVAKCLEKDPARRYASVHELDADLRRHLAGEPILAAPPNFWESVARLARRHRAAAIATAAVLAAILVAAGGILAFAIRAEQARTVAEAQRERAQQSLYVANLVGIAAKRDGNQLGVARALLAETRDLLPPGSPEPIELKAAAASLDESLLVFTGHEAAVETVAFSPDGSRILTGSGDRTARLWDAGTGRELAVLRGHRSGVTSVAFAADNSQIATAAGDGCIRLWGAAGGSPRRTIRDLAKGFLVVASEPAADALLVGGSDGRLLRLGITGDAAPALVADVGSPIRGIATLADGEVIAVATEQGGTVLWRGDGRPVTLAGHRNRVNAVAITCDGLRVATASSDCTFRIWEAATGTPLLTWGGETLLDSAGRQTRRTDRHHARAVTAVAFSPDDRLLATASSDLTAALWDTRSGREKRRFIGHTGYVQSVGFSPDGRFLVTGSTDGTARLWNASQTDGLSQFEEPARFLTGLLFSPSGDRLVSLAYKRPMSIWNPDTCELVASFEGRSPSAEVAAFDRSGGRLAVGLTDGMVRLRELTTGRVLGELPGHSGGVTGLVFTADGSRLMAGAADGTLRCWTLDGSTASEWLVQAGAAGPRALHRLNGDRVLGLCDSSLAVWDAATGAAQPDVPGPAENLPEIAVLTVSNDGRLAAAGLERGSVVVWRLADGQTVAVLDEHRPAVGALAFSPDGMRLAIGDKKAFANRGTRIWDIATAKEIAVLRGEGLGIKAVAYSPQANCLVTGTSLPRVWGPSNAEIHAARRGAQAIRRRLEPLVAGWLAAGPEAVATALAKARGSFSAEEHRLAADMVLSAAAASTH
jgi:eukaryotic-like serine/threonine-protein kinase